jgi:hypothetical protein
MFIDFLKMALVIAVCFAIFSGVRVSLYGMQSLHSADYADAVRLALLAGGGFSAFYGMFVAIYNRLRGRV